MKKNIFNEKVAIDTNVLVYMLNPDSLYYKNSMEIFQKAKQFNAKIYLADKTLYEFYAVMQNLIQKKKMKSTESALDSFKRLLNSRSVSIITSSTKTVLVVQELLENISSKTSKYIHDVVLAAILIENDIDFLFTQNTKDFEDFQQFQTLPL